tara:strand:- start:40 stop:378 length:339 start_codon:yes stop_codon:yes gene_type:complete
MTKHKIKWGVKNIAGGIGNATFKWNTAPNNPSLPRYTWGDVQLIIRAAGEDITQWEDFDKKKLVKLILKVHGNTITESKQKRIKQYKIKANDIKITAEKILGIEVMTENIKF